MPGNASGGPYATTATARSTCSPRTTFIGPSRDPPAGESEAAHFQGEGEGAEQIGATWLYVNEGSDDLLEQVDLRDPAPPDLEQVRSWPGGRKVKQSGQKVTLNGHAQSNEHVSTLLRNLSNVSAWLETPELVEIRAATTGQGKDLRRVFEFTVNVAIKRSPRTGGTPAIVPVSATANSR